MIWLGRKEFGRPSNGWLSMRLAEMSAERGWIADPPPQREHHTPGWLSEKGTGRSHFHSDKYAAEQHVPPADDPLKDEESKWA